MTKVRAKSMIKGCFGRWTWRGRRGNCVADVLPGNSLVVGLSPFEENGHEAEAI
jgi:hypothetical protein